MECPKAQDYSMSQTNYYSMDNFTKDCLKDGLMLSSSIKCVNIRDS